MSDWQGNPDIYKDNCDINSRENFPVETDHQLGSHQLADDSAPQPVMNRCFTNPPAASYQMEDKEASAVDNENLALIDDDYVNDVNVIDYPQPIPGLDEFGKFPNINPVLAAEEAYNVKWTNVETVVESNGKKRSTAKTSPHYWNDDTVLQKPECMRARANQWSRNLKHEHDSLAERLRMQNIKERLQCLLKMIPGRNPVINKNMAVMITEFINYLRFLENQKQLLAEETINQNPTPETNVNITSQLFAEKVSRLAEESSRQNPTPENNVIVIPISEGNQNLVVNGCGGRRRWNNVNKLAALKMKKKSRANAGSSRPAPINAKFAYLKQQAAALYNPNSLGFASQIAPGTAWTSANWSIPQQYVQVPTYCSQDGPIRWDAKTLSFLYQSCYS